MSPERSVVAAFLRRAERAEALATTDAEIDAAPLHFAAGLYRAQAELAGAVEAADRERPLSGRLDEDLSRFARKLEMVLMFAAERAPATLATMARARLTGDRGGGLLVWWDQSGSGREDYLSRALLRPYVEVLAAAGIRPQRRPSDAAGCPFCGGPPWIGSRRAITGGDGAQRFLGCALCGGDWVVNRILCPACGEEEPDKLPSFQSDRHPTVRVEACATCRGYVKSIDLSLDARAIAEVDDLASLAMDLWAHDEGYTRLEPGLAGV